MNNNGNLALPTKRQVEWADCEIGVIIDQDVSTYRPDYDCNKQMGKPHDSSFFNPASLDTDQWLSAAKAAGAQYAVLVAKHCSGFSLWPTAAHEFSVKHSPWKNGKGDIVADFIRSCEKYSIRPGIYYSVSCNTFLNVNHPGKVLSNHPEEQKSYNEIVVKQLKELWANYGKLFEIWFDGGVLSPEEGGADIVPLLMKYQPEAVCFQGPKSAPSLIRWIGTESGKAPRICWSTTTEKNEYHTPYSEKIWSGTPDGPLWMPGETDMPNRNPAHAFLGGWFWKQGEDKFLFPTKHLVDCYYQSVGRNTNFLLGMIIDNRGLVPDADVSQFTRFGAEIKRLFGRSVAETSGTGTELELTLREPSAIDNIVIMEDIRSGEHIREYEVSGYGEGGWRSLCRGYSVGHKRIERIPPAEVSKIKLTCGRYTEIPRIRKLAVYNSSSRQD